MKKRKGQSVETNNRFRDFPVLIREVFTGSLVILFIGVCAFAILIVAMCLL